MAKVAFSRSDVAALAGRMSVPVPQETHYGPPDPNVSNYASNYALNTTLSRAPSSPVAAKVLREVGISSQKITEAYSVALARTTVRR